jgi:hypothetical protein
MNAVLQEIDSSTAVSALDEIFQGWLSSPRCGDELSSPKERAEVMYYYRQIRELLTKIDLMNRSVSWTSENSQN